MPQTEKKPSQSELDAAIESVVIPVTDSERAYVSESISILWNNISAANEWQKDAILQRDYAGKWMRVKGRVRVIGSPEEPALTIEFEDDFKFVKVFFRPEDADKLAPINDNAIVTVDGRISGRLVDLALILRDGEIVAYH